MTIETNTGAIHVIQRKPRTPNPNREWKNDLEQEAGDESQTRGVFFEELSGRFMIHAVTEQALDHLLNVAAEKALRLRPSHETRVPRNQARSDGELLVREGVLVLQRIRGENNARRKTRSSHSPRQGGVEVDS